MRKWEGGRRNKNNKHPFDHLDKLGICNPSAGFRRRWPIVGGQKLRRTGRTCSPSAGSGFSTASGQAVDVQEKDNLRVVSYIYLPYPSHMIGKNADFKHVKYGKLDLAILSEFKKCQMSGVGPSFTVVLTFKNKYFACYYL